MPAEAMLLVKGGQYDGEIIPLSLGITTIGRATFNDIVVDHEGVSRLHARIQADSAGYWILDLGSSNGTYVNGIKLGAEYRLLRRSDLIELRDADTAIQWVFVESEATTEMPR